MPIVAPSSRYTLANNNNGDSNSNTETTTITTTTAAETVKKLTRSQGGHQFGGAIQSPTMPQLKLNGKNFF